MIWITFLVQWMICWVSDIIHYYDSQRRRRLGWWMCWPQVLADSRGHFKPIFRLSVSVLLSLWWTRVPEMQLWQSIYLLRLCCLSFSALNFLFSCCIQFQNRVPLKLTRPFPVLFEVSNAVLPLRFSNSFKFVNKVWWKVGVLRSEKGMLMERITRRALACTDDRQWRGVSIFIRSRQDLSERRAHQNSVWTLQKFNFCCNTINVCCILRIFENEGKKKEFKIEFTRKLKYYPNHSVFVLILKRQTELCYLFCTL